MPNTRSKAAKNLAEVENQNKSTAKVKAKSKSAITRRSSRKTREHLQDITNPKEDSEIISEVIEKLALQEHKPAAAAKMGADIGKELSNHSAAMPPISAAKNCRAQASLEADMEAHLKRKSGPSTNHSGASPQQQSQQTQQQQQLDSPATSPRKRLKVKDMKLLTDEVIVLDSSDNDSTSCMDVNVEKGMEPAVINDGERPSTSKAAAAQAAACIPNGHRSANSSLSNHSVVVPMISAKNCKAQANVESAPEDEPVRPEAHLKLKSAPSGNHSREPSQKQQSQQKQQHQQHQQQQDKQQQLDSHATSPRKRLKATELQLLTDEEIVVNNSDNESTSSMDVNVDKEMEPAVVDDDERPSTSKAAAARAAAIAKSVPNGDRSVNSSPQSLAHDYLTAFTNCKSIATSSSLGSPSSRRCAEERRRTRMKSPLKPRHLHFVTEPQGTTQAEQQESEITEPLSVSEKLLLVTSNLYLNAGERLKLDFPPRCAEDLEHCHQMHYRAPLPAAPNHTQAHNLRCALQQQRYVSFVNLGYDMCHRGEYPDVGILTKLIELVLSFNAKCYNNDCLGYFFNKSIELFSFIVRKFPPCWLSLRRFYVDFLQSPLDAKKISMQNEQTFKGNKLLEILFELLAKTLEQCSSADLECEVNGFNNARTASATSSLPAACATTPSKLNNSMNMSSAELSQPSSEYMNIWDWEMKENRLQSFEALKSPRTQLERVFISLQLVLQILERDFVMWILHHHKRAKDWIFHEESRPFAVLVFGMTKYTPCSHMMEQLFTLFALCVSKRARRSHLKILERFIALVMEANNIADLEYTERGAVCYPNLGAKTKLTIQIFFKLFKELNGTHIFSYLSAIDLLRIPYVRYEFIDAFLLKFHLATSEPMTPKKIAQALLKKSWLKYKPKAQLDADDDDVLSREQYLLLLLRALQAYCDFHGLRAFFHLLVNEEKFDCFRFVTDSVHRYPVEDHRRESLMLHRMADQIVQLEKKLRMTVCMSKPKACLPIIDISISEELLQKYRNDLKYVTMLNNIIDHSEKGGEGKDVNGNDAKGNASLQGLNETKDVEGLSTTSLEQTRLKSATKLTLRRVDFTEWRKFLVAYTTEKK